jgi:hypothetical protein
MTSQSSEEQTIGQVRVQVQPDRAPSLNLVELKGLCRRVTSEVAEVVGFRFEEGNDKGPHLDLLFGTSHPLVVWPFIREALYESPIFGIGLKASSMTVCTGTDGWNNYLLLYHYDPSVPVHVQPDA